MKNLVSELRPALTALAAFSLFINLLLLVPAIFMLQVFDRVLPSSSQETLLVLLVGAGIALVVLMALDYVRQRMQQLLGSLVEEQLSPRIAHAVVEQSARRRHLGQFDALRDLGSMRAAFGGPGLVALFDAPWIAIYVPVIFAFHPVLGVGAAGAAVVMLALAWLNDRMSRGAVEELQQDGRRSAQYLESSLRNAEVLQALGMTRRLLARWRQSVDGSQPLQLRSGRQTTAFAAVTRSVRQSIQILMLALGAWLVLSDQASPGVMIATTILLGRAVQPVEQLVSSWRSLTDGRAAYRRLAALLEDIEAAEARLALPRPEGRLSVETVAYRVPGTEQAVLANVSLQLAAGEALAVVGPSGAGKSTLARLITGIWRPNGGFVRLDGADVASWSRDDLGQWLGYVPQDVELFDGTVGENIARLGPVQPAAVVAAAKRANVHEMIVALPKAYDTPVGEHGARLSPGQRQRIALARALYGDPRLVVLDEPNSNLDGDGELALAKALSALRNEGVTTVVITHRPSLIAHVDKIVMLEAGRVRKYGLAADVLKAMQRESQVALTAQAA